MLPPIPSELAGLVTTQQPHLPIVFGHRLCFIRASALPSVRRNRRTDGRAESRPEHRREHPHQFLEGVGSHSYNAAGARMPQRRESESAHGYSDDSGAFEFARNRQLLPLQSLNTAMSMTGPARPAVVETIAVRACPDRLDSRNYAVPSRSRSESRHWIPWVSGKNLVSPMKTQTVIDLARVVHNHFATATTGYKRLAQWIARPLSGSLEHPKPLQTGDMPCWS